MREIRIRKTAMVLGMCIILLSVLVFLVTEINYSILIYDYLKSGTAGFSYTNYLPTLLTPLTHLISGLGFGGIIILLGCFFGTDKPFSLSQKASTISEENKTEEDIIE